MKIEENKKIRIGAEVGSGDLMETTFDIGDCSGESEVLGINFQASEAMR